MDTAATSSTTTKVCSTCGQRLPIDAFRRIHAGQDWPRRSECSDCRNRREREARRRDRLPRLRDRLRQVRTGRCVRRIDAVLQTLLREFGGINQFSESVAELLHTGRAADRQLAIAATLNLLQAEEDAQQAVRDAERDAEPDWNDPVLQRQACQLGVQFLMQHPDQLAPHVAGLIARKPSILRDALEHPSVKALLSRWDYGRDDSASGSSSSIAPQFADVG